MCTDPSQPGSSGSYQQSSCFFGRGGSVPWEAVVEGWWGVAPPTPDMRLSHVQSSNECLLRAAMCRALGRGLPLRWGEGPGLGCSQGGSGGPSCVLLAAACRVCPCERSCVSVLTLAPTPSSLVSHHSLPSRPGWGQPT